MVAVIVASTAGNRFLSAVNAANRNTGTIATIVVRAITSTPIVHAAARLDRSIEKASTRKSGQYTGVWPINVNRWTSSVRTSAASSASHPAAHAARPRDASIDAAMPHQTGTNSSPAIVNSRKSRRSSCAARYGPHNAGP